MGTSDEVIRSPSLRRPVTTFIEPSDKLGPHLSSLYLLRSKKTSALAETLQQACLRKKDLGLELEELEEAATMVAEEEEDDEEEEEEDGAASDCPPISHSSSGDSSGESEESEAEGQSCTESKEGGGGAEGGGTSKDNPPQPPPALAASPVPRAPASTLPSASQGSRLLIQELGEQMQEELRVSSRHGAERTSGSVGGTLLEPSRNPLLIVATREESDVVL